MTPLPTSEPPRARLRQRLLLVATAAAVHLAAGCGADDTSQVGTASVRGTAGAGGAGTGGISSSGSSGYDTTGGVSGQAGPSAGTNPGAGTTSQGGGSGQGGVTGQGGGAGEGITPDLCCGTDADCPPEQECVIKQPYGRCRDDVCSAAELENAYTCPWDCPAAPTCGDGLCSADEDCTTCPWECAPCLLPRCGDGTCDAGEDCQNCPLDCDCPHSGVCLPRPPPGSSPHEGPCWTRQECTDSCEGALTCACGETDCVAHIGRCFDDIGRPLRIGPRQVVAPLLALGWG